MAHEKLSLKEIKNILALVEHHKLDEFEIPGFFRCKKTRHEQQAQPAASAPTPMDRSRFYNGPTSIEELDAEIEREVGKITGTG